MLGAPPATLDGVDSDEKSSTGSSTKNDKGFDRDEAGRLA